MKSFLEEYGFAILIAIVIITLIVMTSPIGGIIKTSVLGLADDFGNRTAAKIDKTEANLILKKLFPIRGMLKSPFIYAYFLMI